MPKTSRKRTSLCIYWQLNEVTCDLNTISNMKRCKIMVWSMNSIEELLNSQYDIAIVSSNFRIRLSFMELLAEHVLNVWLHACLCLHALQSQRFRTFIKPSNANIYDTAGYQSVTVTNQYLSVKILSVVRQNRNFAVFSPNLRFPSDTLNMHERTNFRRIYAVISPKRKQKQ